MASSKKVLIELIKPVQYKKWEGGERINATLPVGTRLYAFDDGKDDLHGYFPASPFGIYRYEAKVIERETDIYLVEEKTIITRTVQIEANSEEEAEKIAKSPAILKRLRRAKKTSLPFRPTVRFLWISGLREVPRTSKTRDKK